VSTPFISFFYTTGAIRQPKTPAPLIHGSMVYNNWPGGLHLQPPPTTPISPHLADDLVNPPLLQPPDLLLKSLHLAPAV
jgi:hypothetical protein